MLGKPVIRGTRIPVELILRKLGDGATNADLLEAYPQLTREDINAAIGYAADIPGNPSPNSFKVADRSLFAPHE
jgi:uncharacterized protein (DUF433 family)